MSADETWSQASSKIPIVCAENSPGKTLKEQEEIEKIGVRHLEIWIIHCTVFSDK